MPELITTIHGHHLELRCWSKVVSYTAHAMIPQLSAAKKRARASDELSVQGVETSMLAACIEHAYM